MPVLNFITDLALPFLVVITILVFVHELGHYLAARWNGVKVEAFSIGMGPELFGFTDKKDTRWKFCLFPIGGYVKMFGDADAISRPANAPDPDDVRDKMPEDKKGTGGWAHGKLRSLTDEEKAVSFHHKRVGQRFVVVLAGPLANFVFTIAVLFCIFTFIGQASTPAVIGSVLPDSAAAQADLRVGDTITAVNGDAITRFQDLQRSVQINLDREVVLTLLRDGRVINTTLTPAIIEVEDITGRIVPTPRLGITAEGVVYQKLPVHRAAVASVTETWELASLTLRAVGQIITGRRGTEELGGPIRIAELSGKMVEFGFVSFLWFMAVLSLNLGLINLFPIPVLDGGHLVFYAYEGIRGKPMAPKVQDVGFRLGLALVLALFVFVFWNDLSHYWG